MKNISNRALRVSAIVLVVCASSAALAANPSAKSHTSPGTSAIDGPQRPVQLGPRPYWLIQNMDESALKEKLQSCARQLSWKTDFSIGHRGAALQFPEHTKESYVAAARQGAGIVECDVTFTKDRELVCRHSQCDLATTTNILATPLAAKCSAPFTPAANGKPATATCCTSDITLAEFKTLKGKMDASDPTATTVAQFMGGTARFRTDLYATQGTVLSHKESIELFKNMRVKMTPELKTPSVPMPFEGMYTQEQYAQQMIEDYRAAGIAPSRVWPQSFLLSDVKYWIKNEPQYARQAVYLDDRYETVSPPIDPMNPATFSPTMQELADAGVQIIAPPIWMLLTVDASGSIVPSAYALSAKQAGLDIITWTLERSGPLASGGGFYYQSIKNVINNDGDMMTALDVLAQQVGVIGVFSDWPATVTYYANCMGLR